MSRDKNETPGLFAALLTGVLANTLLRTQAGYWPRAGLAVLPLCALGLAGAGRLFARAWRAGQNPLLRCLFAALLAASSALELLRLYRLAARVYPGTFGLLGFGVLMLLPILYLRRVSAVSQTANVVLCLLCVGTGLMLLALFPRLSVTNLQTNALTPADLCTAAAEQMTLYPEYLLPALWPEREKRGGRTVLRLAVCALGADWAVHFVLELFYGAALPARADPLHAAARCGALSVFNRLEWVQLVLWMMAVSVKLALYLYAMTRLLGGRAGTENTAAGLDRFPLYLGGLLLLCAALRQIDADTALLWRGAALWGFALLVWMGGAAAWLCQRAKRCF